MWKFAEVIRVVGSGQAGKGQDEEHGQEDEQTSGRLGKRGYGGGDGMMYRG